MLAGCAAQNAYREGQALLAEQKVEAGLAKIQEAMLLDPSSAEYRIAYTRAQDRVINASLDRAERAGRSALRRRRGRLPPRAAAAAWQ
jgi:general secretion pathway protein D